MNLLKSAVRTSKKHEIVLGCLLVLYIMFNVQTPNVIASVFNNPAVQLILAIFALSILVNVNPILGIIIIIACVEFVRRSSKKFVPYALNNYIPNESKKEKVMNAVNVNPFNNTLEEEVVQKMAPLGGEDKPSLSDAGYSPVLNNLHDASSI